jgi:hypothetical protein
MRNVAMIRASMPAGAVTRVDVGAMSPPMRIDDAKRVTTTNPLE